MVVLVDEWKDLSFSLSLLISCFNYTVSSPIFHDVIVFQDSLSLSFHPSPSPFSPFLSISLFSFYILSLICCAEVGEK